jgi:hypothetical protein
MIYQNDICFHVNIIAEIGRLSSGNLGFTRSLHEILGGDGQAKKFRRAATPPTSSVSARLCFTGG